MVIRIPDFMFAQSTGAVSAPGEPDYETRSVLAAARSTEQEIGALGRGLTLVGEAMKGGEKAKKQLAAARNALGRHGESGALRWLLDHAVAEQARQEAASSRRTGMRTLIGTIKGVGTLPIPFADKAELGRTLLREGVEGGLVPPEQHKLFEDAVISQFRLAQAQTAIAKATEPGEALVIVAAAKAEGGLQSSDSDLLDHHAKERDAVATARHRARLASKEQDDLAAFARGELPAPLSEESFRRIHGARGATGAYARYRAARKEGEALATIRGQDAQAIEAARTAWSGDPAVFTAAVAKDGADRRRDPAGYALATVAGAQAAWDETPEAERRALLWTAQARTGIDEKECSPWALAEEERLAAAWDALPSGHGGRNERLDFLQKNLQGLPRPQREAAIRRIAQQGIVDLTEAQVRSAVTSLDEGRFNAARQLASGRHSGPPRAQQAENDEQRPNSTEDVGPSVNSVEASSGDKQASRADNPSDPWPAGPETESSWRPAVPLPGGKPRDQKDRQQIAELVADLADGASRYATERASRELGIYFQQMPEYRDWLAPLGEVVKTGKPLVVGGVDIDSRGAAALLHQQSKTIANGGEPQISHDPKALKTWNELWQAVEGGRIANYPMAADFLQHYLEGSGQPYPVSLNQLLANSYFQSQLEGLQRHFLAWMLGDQPTGTRSEEIASYLYDKMRWNFALEEGESFTVTSQWDKVLTPDLLDKLGVKLEWNDAAADMLAAFGKAQLRGVGNFTFRREGGAILFEGEVTFTLPDRYDFNPGERFEFSIDGKDYDFTSEDINALQNTHGTQPFDIAVPSWSQSVRGRIVIRPWGKGQQLMAQDVEWGEPH